ncbi:uncharacterized protein LOC132953757 [Metopolophium dirhodum]|uniref:uncharacterized protein LOC132953757 n=1 Tax=Metopolophium dirhodum TaxID=44670 RepID=UPI00299051B1|nr:uncharacterized protein LOC132953757 [Metopolophium dirhodum]
MQQHPSPIDNHNKFQVTNNTPLSIENNTTQNLSLSDKLRSFIVKYKVSHNCCNSLLKILRSEGLEVPKDVRTLMKTPKNHEIVAVSGGSYVHLGIKNMLLPFLSKHNAQVYITPHILKIGINIDGLPIAKSSKTQLWPILISVINFKELRNHVIPIGIFHGFQKPHSIEEFLNPFIIDLLEIIDNGLTVNDTLFTLEISNISCDAPAKAFLLNVKSHNAYFGCTSCTEEGTYLEHRMTYPGLDAPLRTNETFRNKTDDDYHKGDSPLIRLPINIVEIVVLDYMHNVCLGVVKRLIEMWVKGNKQVRLEKMKKEKINFELNNLKQNILKEEDKNIMLNDGSIVSVHHIVQPYKKPVKLLVKQFLNYSESTTVPLSSFKIGVHIINTTQMSEMKVHPLLYCCLSPPFYTFYSGLVYFHKSALGISNQSGFCLFALGCRKESSNRLKLAGGSDLEDLLHDQLSPTNVLARLILIMLWTESLLDYGYTVESRD